MALITLFVPEMEYYIEAETLSHKVPVDDDDEVPYFGGYVKTKAVIESNNNEILIKAFIQNF